MNYDHHQEEIQERWQRTRRSSYETDYDTQLRTAADSPTAESTSSESTVSDPQPTPKLSFWMWLWLNPKHFAHALISMCLLGLTVLFSLQADGIIYTSLGDQRILTTLSIICGMLTIAWLAGITIHWRAYRYRQD